MGGDDDDQHDPDTSASTPNSQSAPQSTTKAPKDRSCPFCGQAFTSSSLGRHLDLYIKPKNPKPADGVHDVTEIRKLRGNITRRQPRSGARAHGDHGVRAVEDSPVASPIEPKSVKESTGVINALNWQATGVINNLPPRQSPRNDDTPPTGQAQRIQEMRRDGSGNRIQRPDPENDSMWKLEQDAELGRAAEMALREVLGSLEAAQKRVEPRTLFEDIDFFSLSFPGLCLAILPPPSTLFSPTPFPSADSWTLGPPGLRQYEAMNRYLNEAVTNKRKVEPLADSVVFKHHAHLSGAWEHWQLMSENDRASAWTLETLRSFARVQDQKKALRTELEQTQQRVKHLESEYDRLSRCQLPREYLMHPPNTIPMNREVLRDIKPSQFKNFGIAEADFDAESLLSKWRSTIRATSRPSRFSRVNHNQPKETYTESGHSQIRDAIVMNGAIYNVGGPIPRNREPHSEKSGQQYEIQSVAYETPPNPGGVISEDAGVDADADEDAEGEAEDDAGTFANYVNQNANALIRRQKDNVNGTAGGGENGGGLAGLLNTNGKRPYAPSPGIAGRSGATKVYKAYSG